MEKMKELFFKYKEQILYIFFGGCTTVTNLVTYAVCTRILHINDYIAILISWILAVLFAYITNKIWVFESKTTNFKEFVRELVSFFAARIATLGMEYVVMFIGVELFKINDMIVKIFVQFLVVVANYILSKLFIFKKD